VPHDPRHLGVPSHHVQNDFQAYHTFSANRAPILRQDWHYLQLDRNELPLEPRHLGVPSGASKRISQPMVRLAQAVHLRLDLYYLQTDRNELPLEPRHLGVPLRASKMISKPMVRLVQTVHLFCAYGMFGTKRFLCLWYVWHKPCTYFVSRLALSLIGL
jgi:hypothetical protein